MTTKPAYYNENNIEAAYWLRELIHEGHIAPGDVDTRSIEDVEPQDLEDYGQCHFFAGIGGWSLALRLAGVPDGYPAWTGSCPCQPFSAAGGKAGFDDERHLLPAFDWLISQRRPPVVFGEQVASKDAEPWIDLVLTNMEGLGYTSGACAFPAAGIGAPEIRDRTYWVAYSDDARSQGRILLPERSVKRAFGQDRLDGRMADPRAVRRQQEGAGEAFAEGAGPAGRGVSGRMADPDRAVTELLTRQGAGPDEAEGAGAHSEPDGRRALSGLWVSDPLDGFWGGADWIFCRDGKWRPVEPGAFPLAHGIPARVGRLRGYGNAIVPDQAALFARIVMEGLGG